MPNSNRMEKTFEYSDFIKNKYPNEWFLIANPTYQGTRVVDGIVLFHSKDKKEVCYIGRAKVSAFNQIALVFTGDIQSNRKNGILQRVF